MFRDATKWRVQIQSSAFGLFAGYLVNHCGQSIEIADEKSPVLAHDDANFRQPIQLAGHRLTMSADAACDFRMGWCRFETGALVLAVCEACQAQQFGLNAIVDGERAEFIDTLGQAPNITHEPF